MLVLIKPDGTAQLQVPVNNYQGSNNVNSIDVVTSLPNTNSIFIACELPNGVVRDPMLMNYVRTDVINGVAWSTYSYPLPYSVTQLRGVLNVSFSIYTGTKPENSVYAAGENLTTNKVAIPINASVPALIPAGDPSTIEDIAAKYQLLATQISSIDQKANDAQDTAEAAETKAENALTVANQAQADVVQVRQDFDAFKTQIESDQSAFETKITDQQNAYETQVNERIGEFESDTTARVDELAQQIGERQGTTVDVGGAAVNRIAFTSDPQTQIDNKVDYAKSQNLTFSQKRTACDNAGAYWVDSETAASETIGTQIFAQSNSNTVMWFGTITFTTSPASAVLNIQNKNGTAMVYISSAGGTITAQLVKTAGNVGDVYYLIASSSVALYQPSSGSGSWIVESQVTGGSRFDRGREIDSLPTGATMIGQSVGGMVSREVNIGAVECPSAQYTTIDYPGGFAMNADGFIAKYAVVSYCPMETYEDDTESSVIVEISAANATRYQINYGGNGQDVGAAAFQAYSASLIVYNYSTSPIYVKRITFYGGYTQ